MGLFDFFEDEKKVVVDSKVYNLSGDPANRPNYLRSLIIRNILSGTKESMGETLSKGYLHGPGVKLRQYYRWVTRPGNYDKIGVPESKVLRNSSIDTDLVEPEIPAEDNELISCQRVNVGIANYLYWAEQWIYLNYPNMINSYWTASVSAEGIITVTFRTGSHSFVAENYETEGTYIYAYYLVNDEQRLFIYKEGSGNSNLDDLTSSTSYSGGFFPYIPIRLRNQFLSSTYGPTAYEQAKKAYKKLTNSSYDALVAILESNPSIGSMDYIYVLSGVPLNTKDQNGLRYLYTFFDAIADTQAGSAAEYSSWKTAYNNADYYETAYYEWYAAQQNPSDPLYGTEPPPKPVTGSPPANYFNINSAGSNSDIFTEFNLRLAWISMEKGRGFGRRDNHKTGTVWYERAGYETIQENGTNRTMNLEVLFVFWQRTDDRFEWIKILGLHHVNYVFQGNMVFTSAFATLDDPEESKFIVPLDYNTFTNTQMVKATQLATASTYLIINTYEVQTIPWWQSGFFAIILVIIIAIAVTVFTGGGGLGLLGANLAVGTALGLTGMTAAIVGSVANALTALVLVSVIQKVAVAVFGDIVGGIIAAVATIIITAGVANNWTFGIDTLFNPENILKITNAVGEGYTKYLNGEIKEIEQEIRDYTKWADAESDKIQEQYMQEFGGVRLVDPMWFTENTKSLNESPATFLQRTLLTGNDIAELSHELLSNFAEHSLKLPTAFT